MKALKLSIYSLIPVIFILFSVSAFSMRSKAYYSTEDFNVNNKNVIGVSNNIPQIFYWNTDRIDLRWGLYYDTAHNVCIALYDANGSEYYQYAYYFVNSNGYQITTRDGFSYNGHGISWVYGIFRGVAVQDLNIVIYDSKLDLFLSSENDIKPPVVEPEFADFGLDELDYVVYKDNLLAFNTNYYLDYYVTWSGSDNSLYPLTNVNYEIYGFTDVLFDNADKSNGTLLSSGECSSPFDTRGISLFDDVNINLADTYMKCVLYLIPFSDNYQGNTSYIVFNRYRDSVIASFGPFEVDLNDILRIESSSVGVGIIPVNPTDVIDRYGVSYIGDAPVTSITQTFNGTIYNDNRVDMSTQYNPIIYDNSNNITNYYNDNSTNITNNDYSTNITNNISKEQNIDKSKQEVYEKNVISFLSMLVTFITSMWTFALNGLQWLPIWSQTLVTVLFSVTGTVIIALGIFKLFTK